MEGSALWHVALHWYSIRLFLLIELEMVSVIFLKKISYYFIVYNPSVVLSDPELN